MSVKATSMDVAVFEFGSVQGKTDPDGSYEFDVKLPVYFAGRPLSQGAARVLVEATGKDSAGHAESHGEPMTVSETPLLVTADLEGGIINPEFCKPEVLRPPSRDSSRPRAELTVSRTDKANEQAV